MARTVCPMNGLYLCRFGIKKFPKKLVIYLLCRKLIVEKINNLQYVYGGDYH